MPREVAELMNACLHHDPKQRPSAKQVYDALVASAAAMAAHVALPPPPSAQVVYTCAHQLQPRGGHSGCVS